MSSVSDSRAGEGLYAAPLTKTELAYKHVRREIIEGILPPDTVLDQEALAERLGLSTTPVREALRMLESEQLVVSRRHRNTVVTSLDYKILEETYAVRLSLDPLAASLSAAQATDEERAVMDLLGNEDLDDKSAVAYLTHNRALHRSIYSACGNRTLTQMLDSLWDRSDRYRMVTLEHAEHVQIAAAEHRAIIDAILAHDGDKASALMYDHLAESLQRIRVSARQT